MVEIKISEIDRVFGHVKVDINLAMENIDVKLKITQVNRFIESIVVGKHYVEVPYIVARICGACSISHLLASIHAIEDALKITPPSDVKVMRRILHELQVIQNNALFLYLLALPDYLECKNIYELAKKHVKILKDALKLNSLCLKIIEEIAGRIVHPSRCTIGGFTKDIPIGKIRKFIALVKEMKKIALESIHLFTNLELPKFEETAKEYAALNTDEPYTFLEGKIKTSTGLEIEPKQYHTIIKEFSIPYSTSKICLLQGRPFYVGPRARLNTNWHKIPQEYKNLLNNVNIPIRNPFANITVKALEILYCIDDILNKLYELESKPHLKLRTSMMIEKREGEGIGVIEAPRGLLIHHYKFSKSGTIKYANIITPTCINSKHMEISTIDLVKKIIDVEGINTDIIEREVPKLIRSYDPCLPCATHAIKINVRIHR